VYVASNTVVLVAPPSSDCSHVCFTSFGAASTIRMRLRTAMAPGGPLGPVNSVVSRTTVPPVNTCARPSLSTNMPRHVRSSTLYAKMCSPTWPRPLSHRSTTAHPPISRATVLVPCSVNLSKRYASSGPPFPSYASWATSSANGSVYRAIRNGPASTGSNPTPPISSAATVLAFLSSPQYTRLGLAVLRLPSYTPNKTSLGTELNAQTTRAFGTRSASSSAPEDEWARTSSVLSSFIGSEQVTITLPAKSPA